MKRATSLLLALALAAAAALAPLLFFKYFNTLLGAYVPESVRAFSLLTPVGISFFTFKAVAYLAEVYKGALPPCRHFGRYALYVSFFPEVSMGPIQRPGDLMAQIGTPRAFDAGRAVRGAQLMLWGYFEKLVVADNLAPYVSAGLDAPDLVMGLSVFLASVLYAVQLYADFAGYSHIAIGCMQLLGFDVPENFRAPYFSTSVKEFWNRWHISLSSWLRDYVYIPLGGSKKGEGRTYLNLLVVWLFTGLWHGSTLNFLLWGLFLFALISLERLGWGKVLRRSQVISRLYMLLVIPLSWMLFAIPSLKDIGSYIGRLFAFSGGTAVHARDFLVYGRQYAVVLVIGLLVSTPLPEKLWRRIRTSPLGTVLLLVLFWVCVYCMAGGPHDPLFYFSF